MKTQGPSHPATRPLAAFPADSKSLSIESFGAHVILRPASGDQITATASENGKFSAPQGQTRIYDNSEEFYAIQGGCNPYDDGQPQCYMVGDVLVIPQSPLSEPKRLPIPAIREQLIVEVPAGFAGKLRIRVMAHGVAEILPGVTGTLDLNAENGGQIHIVASGPYGWSPERPGAVYGPVRRFDGQGIYYARRGRTTPDGYEFEWISPFDGWYRKKPWPTT